MVQKFYSGETLSASKLNGMVDEINSIKRQIDEQRIVDFEGGDLDVSANGTVLSVRQMRPHVGGNSSTTASDHPFKVSASYADGKVSITMKGGCWHGNGAGNYLGISYLEKPAEELTDIPTLQKGEDLFIIPDCEVSQPVSVGEMFAICLYSPATDGGKLVNYPWAYFKKITSAADFRQELAKHELDEAFSISSTKDYPSRFRKSLIFETTHASGVRREITRNYRQFRHIARSLFTVTRRERDGKIPIFFKVCHNVE